MGETEVPWPFLCPISMQLMRDPVTVSTGITYDRESIERWLFSCKNNNCPVTKQVLSSNPDILTPNHTLHRLIQSWCSINNCPVTKQVLDKTQMAKLIDEAKKLPKTRSHCLQRIRSIAQVSHSFEIVEFLSFIMKDKEFEEVEKDEALSIFSQIDLSSTSLRKLMDDNGEFLEALLRAMRSSNFRSRSNAMTLLKSVLEVADPMQLISAKCELLVEIINILKDNISMEATKAALKLLMELCPWGKNRIKASEAGLVFVLIELLLNTSERRVCELVLAVLDLLCGCAEGRAEVSRHQAGLAIISKKILRVSHVASDRAVKILSLVSRYSGSTKIVHEMLEVGVVAKLCLVLQVECGSKTKERVKEVLRLHSRDWKNASCIPPHLLSAYPHC